MMNEERYLVAGTKPWNRRVFDEVISAYPGVWRYLDRPEDLTAEKVSGFSPRFIFFLHWSWKVPQEIVDRYECVCFHMTDVPYGRGGSPLQNLILCGHRHTKLTALRMTEEIDAGPVYYKEDLCLEGNAEEIYIRASFLSSQMIRRILEERPEPRPQEGGVMVFPRRKPHESRIPGTANSLESLFDFIRMLDAEGYPHAFLQNHNFRYEFTGANLYDGRIVANVIITRVVSDRA